MCLGLLSRRATRNSARGQAVDLALCNGIIRSLTQRVAELETQLELRISSSSEAKRRGMLHDETRDEEIDRLKKV